MVTFRRLRISLILPLALPALCLAACSSSPASKSAAANSTSGNSGNSSSSTTSQSSSATATTLPNPALAKTGTFTMSYSGGYSASGSLALGNVMHDSPMMMGGTVLGTACTVDSQTDAVIPFILTIENATPNFSFSTLNPDFQLVLWDATTTVPRRTILVLSTPSEVDKRCVITLKARTHSLRRS